MQAPAFMYRKPYSGAAKLFGKGIKEGKSEKRKKHKKITGAKAVIRKASLKMAA